MVGDAFAHLVVEALSRSDIYPLAGRAFGKLLGEGWSDPERALEIQLALRLHRLGHTSEP